MRYFVTGATGFLGGRVAQQLRAAGHQVVALARDPGKGQAMAALGVELARGDVTDKESMRAAMTGADGVFHIAGWFKLGVRDKRPAVATNVEGTRNVLEVMKELGIAKGVYTSTLAVNSDTHGKLTDESYRFEGKHLSEYDRTKAAAHDVARDFIKQGLPLVIVQPSVIYGPGDAGPVHDVFVQYLQRKLPMAAKRTAFGWVHVEDAARGHILAMERGRPGESYFLAGPSHALTEALALCEKLTGVRGPRLAAPPWVLKASAAMMSVVERVVPVPDTFTAEYLRENAGTTYIGDSAKAKRELGWEPRPLSDGLPETVQWEMKQLGMAAPAAPSTPGAASTPS
jgi:nucleoside-diphosphate-sugar epimerase